MIPLGKSIMGAASIWMLMACTPPVAIGQSAHAAPEHAPVIADNSATTPQPGIKQYVAEIVAAYPHDPTAFTQGLFFHAGALYEGTGRYGQSTLRRVHLETGEVLAGRRLPDTVFGEGIALWQDKIIGLTWQSGIGFVFDLASLIPVNTFTYTGEGWGLTANETHLILSDGTSVLRFLDPQTFKMSQSVEVTRTGIPVWKLNELEWIDGEVWANVWEENVVLRIDPQTGHVTGEIDLSPLVNATPVQAPRSDVLNGIAHDAATGRIFVTGKNWPTLYEIKIHAAE
ncbi:MAG: glutaminyl-peptide cyclotransferase [Pseudomonadota bacterium]